MPDSTLPGRVPAVLRPVPRCPRAIGPRGAQICGLGATIPWWQLGSRNSGALVLG